jgi:hypothetical protein
MKTIRTKPGSAAIGSFLLALPSVILTLLVMLGIEPSLGPLDRLLTENGSHLGSIIALGAALLLLVAFIVSISSILRSVRAGNGITSKPASLLLAIATLFFIVLIAGGIVVDQYPCWIGVPNCD